MYTLSQIETNSNQILNFKSLSDTERYWDIFIYKMNLTKLKYLKPILIPSSGYSYSQLQKWDFFNCVIPIPVFSEEFKAKMKDILIDEMEFVPCELISTKGNIIANMGLIKNNLPLLNEEKSGRDFSVMWIRYWTYHLYMILNRMIFILPEIKNILTYMLCHKGLKNYVRIISLI